MDEQRRSSEVMEAVLAAVDEADRWERALDEAAAGRQQSLLESAVTRARLPDLE